jgi:hypothetical protein
MSDRDQQVLTERIAGGTLRDIGARHGLSHEGVRVVADRAARRHLDDLQARLAANIATDNLEVLLIPGHSGPDFDEAIAYVQWVTRELAGRGVKLRVHYRPADSGVAFGLQAVIEEETA